MQRSEGEARPVKRAQIEELADRVRRLCPDHRDPHRFHEEKSEIAHDLRQLARVVA